MSGLFLPDDRSLGGVHVIETEWRNMIRKVCSATSTMRQAMGKSPSTTGAVDAGKLSLHRRAAWLAPAASWRTAKPQGARRLAWAPGPAASPTSPTSPSQPPPCMPCRARKRAVLDMSRAALRGDGRTPARPAGAAPPAAAAAEPGRQRNMKAELCSSLASWKPFSPRAGGGAQGQGRGQPEQGEQRQYELYGCADGGEEGEERGGYEGQPAAGGGYRGAAPRAERRPPGSRWGARPLPPLATRRAARPGRLRGPGPGRGPQHPASRSTCQQAVLAAAPAPPSPPPRPQALLGASSQPAAQQQRRRPAAPAAGLPGRAAQAPALRQRHGGPAVHRAAHLYVRSAASATLPPFPPRPAGQAPACLPLLYWVSGAYSLRRRPAQEPAPAAAAAAAQRPSRGWASCHRPRP
jgi:hypothetical protein